LADIKGMGLCGLCHKPIQDERTGVPSPIRHFQGHLLAHKRCYDAHELEKGTSEYQVRAAEQKVANAESTLLAAQAGLDAARLDLKRLRGE
jgi:hypothetical protein